MTTTMQPRTDLAAARIENGTKTYGKEGTKVRALDGVSARFEAGRFTAIMGPSGSGKSTLLHCIAGLDALDGGTVHIGEVELGSLNDRELTRLRRERVARVGRDHHAARERRARRVRPQGPAGEQERSDRDREGFVFQAFNLIPTLSAEENILLPLSIAGSHPDPAWYAAIVETLGLANRLEHRPSELSGGQQQRVAAARALVSRPEIVFADEPSGTLDSKSGAELLSFMRRAVREFNQTIVMVTHDPVAASYADRIVFLADGSIVDDMTEPTPEAVLDRIKSLGG